MPTWYATNSLVSVHQEMSETSPGSNATSSPNVGWTVSTGATNHSELDAGVKRAATTFTGTTVPDGTPDTTLGDCLRTTNAYTGTFSSGNWTVTFSVIGVTNSGAQDGRMRCRLLRGANADGSGATEITAAQQQGGLVTNLSTTQQDSAVTFNPGSFSVTNEYIFVQIAWERTGAGGMSTTDVVMRIGTTATRVASAAFSQNISREHDDSVSVTDSTTPDGSYSRTADDSVSVTDSVSSGLEYSRTASDSVSVTDEATSEVSGVPNAISTVYGSDLIYHWFDNFTAPTWTDRINSVALTTATSDYYPASSTTPGGILSVLYDADSTLEDRISASSLTHIATREGQQIGLVFRLSSTTGTSVLLQTQRSSYTFTIRVKDGELRVSSTSTSVLAATMTASGVTVGWHTLVVDFRTASNEVRLYLDDVLVDTETMTFSANLLDWTTVRTGYVLVSGETFIETEIASLYFAAKSSGDFTVTTVAGSAHDALFEYIDDHIRLVTVNDTISVDGVSYDPAVRSLEGWWRAAYSGSPWAGTSSAGSSGSSRDLSEATNPPTAGDALNSYNGAVFDGTNDILSGAALSTFIGASAWGFTILCRVDTLKSGNSNGEGELIGDSLGTLCLGTYSDSGTAKFVLQQYDTVWRQAEVSFSGTGNVVCVQGKADGSSIYIRVNGGSWVSTTCGANASLAGNLQLGASRAAFSRFFDGTVWDFIIDNVTPSDTDFNNDLQYLANRYNVTLGSTSPSSGDTISRSLDFSRSASDAVDVTDTSSRVANADRTASDSIDVTDQASRVANADRTATDSIDVTDATTRESQYERAQTDTVNVTDTGTRDGTFVRSSNDTADVTDQALREQTEERVNNDTAATTDDLTYVKTGGQLIDQVVDEPGSTVTDQTSREVQFARASDDASTTTDATTRETIFDRTSSDTATTTDTGTPSVEFARATDDTASVADTASPSLDFLRSLSDSVSVTDTSTRDGTFVRSSDDAASVTDAALREADFLRSSNDTASVTDTASPSLDFLRTLSDAISVDDTATRNAEFERSAADSVSVTDVVSFVADLHRLISDSIVALDDSDAQLAGIISAVVTDAIDIVDTVTRVANATRFIDDTASVADALTVNSEFGRILSDAASVTDSNARNVEYDRASADSVSTTDTGTTSGDYVRTVTDSASASDTLAGTVEAQRVLSDSVSVADSLERLLTVDRSVSDSASVTDLVLAASDLLRSASDSISVSDLLTLTLNLERIVSDAAAVGDEAIFFVGEGETYAFEVNDYLSVDDAVARAIEASREHFDSASVVDVLDVITVNNTTLALIASKVRPGTVIVAKYGPSTTIRARHRQATFISTRLSMSILHVGDTVNIDGDFKDGVTGALLDPTTVQLKVVRPDDTTTTYTYGVDGLLTKLSTGKYRAAIDCTQAGRWDYVWISPGPTGKGTEPGWFDVEATV